MYSTASGEIPSVGKVDLAWIQTSGHEPQENIDYDVADDNDWGAD
jgi:hypothetical protein